MYIITIIPLTHKTPFTELNYFSLTSYEEGSCVDAPLGKQTLVGIVIGSKQVLESKQDLKNANFQIKQLPKQIPKFKLPYLYTYKELSRYYFKSLDFIIKNTLPYDRIEDQIFRKENIIEKNKILLIQDTFEKRIEYYKEIINNSYKNNQNIVILAPTEEDTLLIYKKLKDHVPCKSYAINSKNIDRKYNNGVKEVFNIDSHLIITTPYYLTLFTKKTYNLIIENESSRLYINHITKIDMKMYARLIADLTANNIYLADRFLSGDSFYKLKENLYKEAYTLNWDNAIDEKNIKIIQREKGTSYKLFSSEIEYLIKDTVLNKSKMILFSLRNGLATQTKCSTCRETLCCPDCNIPLILITKIDGRIFICNICKKNYSTFTPCFSCSGNNLIPYGVGTQTIENEIKEKYPNFPIHRIDAESIKTKKDIRKIITEFEENESGFLITGNNGIKYLNQQVKSSAIISIDSLFELPILDNEKKILNIIDTIASKTTMNGFFQFFNTNETILKSYITNDIYNWSVLDLEEKNKFNFPPKTILIKYSFKTLNEGTIKDIKEFWTNISFGENDHTVLKNKKTAEYTFIGRLYIINTDWEINNENKEIKNKIFQELNNNLPIGGFFEINPENLI